MYIEEIKNVSITLDSGEILEQCLVREKSSGLYFTVDASFVEQEVDDHVSSPYNNGPMIFTADKTEQDDILGDGIRKQLPAPAIGDISRSIENRDHAILLTKKALKYIQMAKDISPPYIFENLFGDNISFYSQDLTCRINNDKINKAIDTAYWKHILEVSKIGVVMNTDQTNEFKQMAETSPPEFDWVNASSTFLELYKNMGTTFNEGLVSLFKSLECRYKSHDPFKISKKVILADAFRNKGWNGYSDGRERVSDLWRILTVLDGKDPTMINRDLHADNIILKARENDEGEYDLEYFKARLFGNGNLHIIFDRRPDLIDAINDKIAEHYGAALPKAS